jgi:threonine dehydrogenase-like Zn-dependent dehydrogenase
MALTGLKSGDTVLVNVAVPCGKCRLCKAGDGANCVNLKCTYFNSPEKGSHIYGGFADYCYAPATNLTRIPDGLPVKTALVFACAGPTIVHAMKAPSKKSLRSVKTAVIQGLGPVGLFAALYLKSMGVGTVIAITTGRNEKRMELASALGVDEFISIMESDAAARAEKIRNMSGGLGADLVMECSGNPEAFNEGLQLLRNRGVYLVPGQYSNSGSVAIEPQVITFKALQIFGSAQYDVTDQKDYLNFLMGIPAMWPAIDRVCTHEWPLSKINEAMDACISGDAVKSMIIDKGNGK